MAQAIRTRMQAVRADQEQGAQVLTLVPILGPSHTEPDYRLLEAEVLQAVEVTEVSEGGSVPELAVRNPLQAFVFLMDGQELVGAKQNRILNTDVLVPPSSTLRIPVSCVEQGRWGYTSRTFTPGSTASYRTRRGKSERVTRSLMSKGTHDADQMAVWDEVHMELAAAASPSRTGALRDAYAARAEELAAFRRSVRLPEQAVGMAVFRGRAFQGLDLFDRHRTLVYFWESLLDSYALAGLGQPAEAPQEADQPAQQQTITQVLEQAAAGRWASFASPGAGRDYRLEDERFTGSALVWEDQTVLHLQVFPRAAEQADGEPTDRARRPRLHRRYGPRA